MKFGLIKYIKIYTFSVVLVSKNCPQKFGLEKDLIITVKFDRLKYIVHWYRSGAGWYSLVPSVSLKTR